MASPRSAHAASLPGAGSVTQVLADGRILFSYLHEAFDARPTALAGRNGAGKSMLAAILAGRLVPTAGRCVRRGRVHYLPQQVVPSRSDSVADLAGVGPALAALARRLRLAQLGLDAARIVVPARVLSDGERLEAALACVLHAAEPPQLLLLDEPDNHLDLDSKQALERMLRDFPGALAVVSHDDAFLDGLALDTRLQAGRDGWQLTPW